MIGAQHLDDLDLTAESVTSVTGAPIRRPGGPRMPWRETCQMDERVKFIAAYLRGEHALTDLCQSFGISRKTVETHCEHI